MIFPEAIGFGQTPLMTPIRVRYDADADAAYFCFADAIHPGEAVLTVPVGGVSIDGIVNLDVDAQGRLLGLEVLNARRLLRPEILPSE